MTAIGKVPLDALREQTLRLDTLPAVKYNNFIEELSGMRLLVITGETEVVPFNV